MILKNKIFIILFLFIILAICLCNSVFASFDFSYNDNDYSFSDFSSVVEASGDTNTNYVILNVYNDQPLSGVNYVLFTFSHTLYKTDYLVGGDDCVYILDDEFNEIGEGHYYYYRNNSWEHFGTNWSSFNNGRFNIIYSTSDVYDYSDKTTVVFQGALSTQVTIPAIQQVGEIPQAMEQVLKILIPIGLIVFSVGLVIYLTRLVISRVQ